MPFDRLIKAVDQWAYDRKRDDLFAQIGAGGWKPYSIRHAEFMDPPEFLRLFKAADMIVAHAGMGTILTALQHQKPVIVMPRRASLGEQRNEHQLATARHMSELKGIEVAYGEEELRTKLDDSDHLFHQARIGAYAQESLQASIRAFIHGKNGSPKDVK